jgi:1,3-beta-glucan synthase
MTWGIWLVAASLIFSPFWFIPHTFSTSKVRTDLKAFAGWLSGEIDADTGTSWYSWNAQQLEKVHTSETHVFMVIDLLS